MTTKYQVVYFPYLFLVHINQVHFGTTTVWNFKRRKDIQILNKELREYISRLLAMNERVGRPIEDIGVVTFEGATGFERPEGKALEKQTKQVEELRKVLFLSGVAYNNIRNGPNAGHFMVTKENFSIVYQNFTMEDEYTGFSSGRIIANQDYGYKIGKIRYEAPRYVLKTPFSCDKVFLDALERLRNNHRMKFLRVLRATDAMMNGYANSDDVSYESRILEQARAFEFLFDLPEKDQRKVFKDSIRQYCSSGNVRKIRYKSERVGERKVWEHDVPQVRWADLFYTLRNHIIHGLPIGQGAWFCYGQPHHHLGLWFFLVSLKKMINEWMSENLFFDTINYERQRFSYDNGLLAAAAEKAWKHVMDGTNKAEKI